MSAGAPHYQVSYPERVRNQVKSLLRDAVKKGNSELIEAALRELDDGGAPFAQEALVPRLAMNRKKIRFEAKFKMELRRREMSLQQLDLPKANVWHFRTR